jgi:hypothetical protein
MSCVRAPELSLDASSWGECPPESDDAWEGEGTGCLAAKRLRVVKYNMRGAGIREA